MIKASELRIGNLVDCSRKEYNEKYIEVESISFEKINVDFREYNIKDLLGIPITEEWLLKLGFERQNNSKFLIAKDIGNSDKYFPSVSMDNVIFIYSGCKVDLKYIHQLQNLYYALTGEELIIDFI